MANGRGVRGPQDRQRINMSEDYEIAYRSRKWGVASERPAKYAPEGRWSAQAERPFRPKPTQRRSASVHRLP
jgi:hypothetical protein